MSEPELKTAAPADEQAIYAQRFSERERRSRRVLWTEIVRYLQRYVPTDATVLDIGTDEGQFITQIAAGERWAADLRDVSGVLPPAVHFIQGSGLELDRLLPADYFDRIFMSNYLEHLPSGQDVIEQFRVCYRLLKPGGCVIVLQPNIALVGPAYWDFIDHKVALTHRSLEEAATIAGLTTRNVVVRFLPYSTKGRLPMTWWLVRAYLRLPLAWRIMGRQTLFVAERAA